MSQAANRNKPPLPAWLEALGWAALIALSAGVLSSTGCRGVEYTAGASVVHDEGPQHYTAKIELTSTNCPLAN